MAKPLGIGLLLALVDALHRGTLSPSQPEIVRTLREGLSRLAEQEMVTVRYEVGRVEETYIKG
jgi:hypothetical protein